MRESLPAPEGVGNDLPRWGEEVVDDELSDAGRSCRRSRAKAAADIGTESLADGGRSGGEKRSLGPPRAGRGTIYTKSSVITDSSREKRRTVSCCGNLCLHRIDRDCGRGGSPPDDSDDVV